MNDNFHKFWRWSESKQEMCDDVRKKLQWHWKSMSDNVLNAYFMSREVGLDYIFAHYTFIHQKI